MDYALVKLSICGPSDVSEEVAIAKKVIDDWNHIHGEARGFFIKHQHWKSDTFPDASQTGQGAINTQIIDESDILVAIFWGRLGTPTKDGISGTAEEIQRGIKGGRKVLVYFSNREPLPADADQDQVDMLWRFREALKTSHSYASFQTRSQFREDFTNHLALAVKGFGKKLAVQKTKPVTIKQIAKGSKNIQIAGDGNKIYHVDKPPNITEVVERDPGWITPKEEAQVAEWIEALVDGTTGKTRDQAFGEWGARLLKKFRVPKREKLRSDQMTEVEAWFIQQRGIQTSGLKRKAPNRWVALRIKAIKAAMSAMGKDKETYYSELTSRLKLKQPLVSLKQLTKTDLDRVYWMVQRDASKSD